MRDQSRWHRHHLSLRTEGQELQRTRRRPLHSENPGRGSRASIASRLACPDDSNAVAPSLRLLGFAPAVTPVRERGLRHDRLAPEPNLLPRNAAEAIAQ